MSAPESGPPSMPETRIGPPFDQSLNADGARFGRGGARGSFAFSADGARFGRGGVGAVAVAALAVTADQQSAPVTDWGPRALLTLATVALVALGVWGMRRGWRHRAARQDDVPAPPPVPDGLPQADAVSGLYVATTTAGDLLDRIVVHGLGSRGRAELFVRSEGVLIDRVGEPSVWIPRDSLRAVRLGSGQAQKAFEAGGLILMRWMLGPRDVETGFRADDPDEHVAVAQALAALLSTNGGSR